MTEKELNYLEQQIPIVAETATKQAYWQTLAAGDNVMIAENGQLIEVFPDGTRKFFKEIGKPVKMTKRLFKITK